MVSKDINTLARSWLRSSTNEKDNIKLPTPPIIVHWTERLYILSKLDTICIIYKQDVDWELKICQKESKYKKR